ncbi:MAG TPA: FtsK/SpoIIIE domain-containing protein [Candidatus Acidoferrales bacterium]|nr:FtsK/SpoIIIE domain-containing protein [Candidatus Acidoferrales bacterium]
MNKNPGVSEMLAVVDALKDAVEDFAAREEKLNQEFEIRSAAELNANESAKQEQHAQQAEALAAAEAALAEEKNRGNARFEMRKVQINRAHSMLSQRVFEEGSEQEGELKTKIRKNSAEAERRREAELADAAAAFENLQKKLDESGETLARLEKSARWVFRGYGRFRRLLRLHKSDSEPGFLQDENQLFEEFQRLESKTREDLKGFRKILSLRIFRVLPVSLVALLWLGAAAAVPVLRHFGQNTVSWPETVPAVLVLSAILLFYFLGRRTAGPAAIVIAGQLKKARLLFDACLQKSAEHYEQQQAAIHAEFDATTRDLSQEWKRSVRNIVNTRGVRPMALDQKAIRAAQKNEAYLRAGFKRLEQLHTDRVASLRAEAGTRAAQLAEVHARKMSDLQSQHQARWQALELEWKNRIEPIYATIQSANSFGEQLFPGWDTPFWQKWTPPEEFKNAARFGRMEVALETLARRLPKDRRLSLPGPSNFAVPLSLAYPLQGSILFETGKTGGNEAVAAINNIIFRLLSTTPPGKLTFTIFDPVGLGQNFAALMHLADYEEIYINSRIWTQTAQFEEKLAELNEHMEKVIQMYLRNEYATISEYNAEAGAIAEKYHFLVIASFPVNFSETAARRLRNIAASGARCGVYTLIQWDQRQAPPQEFVPDELRKNSVCLTHTENGFRLSAWRPPGTKLLLDPQPAPEIATRFLHQMGESGKDSSRVEVPFAQVAPADSEIWKEDTTDELRVPIGRSGATKLQYLAIGKATRQHGLIAGKTGSGKSTLFHVIITNLALWCSPEQVEFYLVDFKKGVEFKCYANRRLPHAKVVAIESDRAFGLSVLERVDAELRRRGDLFRKVGAQDLAGYKRAGGTEPMPRSLLMIDEFQEFFVEEDRVSQGAAVLLDRLIRQGRAFGIHVLLGSQTLGGAYTLARATIGQMVIRIALQCNEADAYLIMDQDNPAPRLLSRPGEGIYNDTAGSIEGNSPFQTVWLPDQERDGYLAKIRARADKDRYPGPLVFEGNAPADIRENLPLRLVLESPPVKPVTQARIWLGAPNSIKGPTEAVFQRQSGSNLLIVGQNEERTLTALSVALVSLAAQYPPGSVRFILLDSTPPGLPQREYLQRIIQTIPHEVTPVNNSCLDQTLGGLAEELKRRSEDEKAEVPEIFILIQGLQNFKKLRQEDEFGFSGDAGAAVSPAAALLNLLSEGPGRAIHVIAACDTYNNVNRFLGRKTLSEFEMRVLFQMSASDSASLIDNPDAATLGLHRALFYNDREGYLETFRPYAQPGSDWIEETAQNLASLRDTPGRVKR